MPLQRNYSVAAPTGNNNNADDLQALVEEVKKNALQHDLTIEDVELYVASLPGPTRRQDKAIALE